jgi:hypothetical protein
LPLLYRVRRWIDQRVPRDILCVKLSIDGQCVLSKHYLELLADLKGNDLDTAAYCFRTEHGNRIDLETSIRHGYPS